MDFVNVNASQNRNNRLEYKQTAVYCMIGLRNGYLLRHTEFGVTDFNVRILLVKKIYNINLQDL